jgi:SPP1 family predicted phage head-tail adaptor
MDIGKLDKKIALRNPTENINSFGQVHKTFGQGVEVWAQKIDVVRAASELENEAMQEQTKKVSRFIIRWTNYVNGKTQIYCDGVEYSVTQIAEIGRKRALEIVAISDENNNYD